MLFIRLFIILSVLASLACSRRSPKEQGGGGVDGGGGHFSKPTREEALRQIESAWKLLTLSRPDNPVLVAYMHIKRLQEEKKMNPEEAEILVMIEKILDLDPKEDLLKNFKPNMKMLETIKIEIPELEMSRYLKPKKLQFEESKLCTGPAHEPSMAAVTKLSRDGEICISIFGITQQPTASLKTDILGLFIHEIAHLNGYQENEARKIQNYFVKTADLALRMKGEYFLTRYWTLAMYQISQGIVNVLIDEDEAKAGESFIKIVRQLGYMLPVPYWGDDVPLAKPDQYSELANRFVVFGQDYKEHLQTRKLEAFNSGKSGPVINPETLAKKRVFVKDAHAILEGICDYLFGRKHWDEKMTNELNSSIDMLTDPQFFEDLKTVGKKPKSEK